MTGSPGREVGAQLPGGANRFLRFPSGSRKSVDRFPHGHGRGLERDVIEVVAEARELLIDVVHEELDSDRPVVGRLRCVLPEHGDGGRAGDRECTGVRAVGSFDVRRHHGAGCWRHRAVGVLIGSGLDVRGAELAVGNLEVRGSKVATRWAFTGGFDGGDSVTSAGTDALSCAPGDEGPVPVAADSSEWFDLADRVVAVPIAVLHPKHGPGIWAPPPWRRAPRWRCSPLTTHVEVRRWYVAAWTA